MSANYPPPPSGGQNPYGQQQPPQSPSPYGASPYASGAPASGAPGTPGAPTPGGFNTPPAPGGFNGSAYAPPAPIGTVSQGNPALGVVLAVVGMIIGLFIYAGLMRAMSKDDGTFTEIGYVGVVVGGLVGFAAGKFGGRNPSLPVVAALLGVLGVFLGQYVGFSMIGSHIYAAHGIDAGSWFTWATKHHSAVWAEYKHDFDFKTFLYLALGGIAGFGTTKRVAG